MAERIAICGGGAGGVPGYVHIRKYSTSFIVSFHDREIQVAVSETRNGEPKLIKRIHQFCDGNVPISLLAHFSPQQKTAEAVDVKPAIVREYHDS